MDYKADDLMKKIHLSFIIFIVTGIFNIALISFLATSLNTSVRTLMAFAGDYNNYRGGITKINETLTDLSRFVGSQHQDTLRAIAAQQAAQSQGKTTDAPVSETPEKD